MRTRSFILAFLFSAVALNAQQLTIEEAVLQPGFFPASPRVVWSFNPGSWLELRNQSLVEISVKNGKETTVLTLDAFNEILKTNGIAQVATLAMPALTERNTFLFSVPDKLIDYDPVKRAVVNTLPVQDSMMIQTVSPDGRLLAFTVGQNLYVAGSSGQVRQITSDKEPGIVNGQSVSRNEFGISGGQFWSPRGNLLAFYRKDESKVPLYPLVDISKTPGRLREIRYPMAGGPSETVELDIFRISDGALVRIQENSLGENCYLTNISWDPGEGFVYIAVLNRAQNHMALNQYDAVTGQKIRTLFEEKSDKYVEPLHGMLFNPVVPDQFLWFSERDGYTHLYLYRTDGSLIRQVTQGEFVVTDFLGWDPKGKYIFVTTTGESPLERHAYRVDLTNSMRTRLTRDAGTHEVTISPDAKYLIDSYSSYSVPRKVVVRDMSGAEIKPIFNAPDPLAGKKLGVYKPFTIKSADKKTDLYGYLVLPPDLDPAKKYPVIVYVYGGPHAQLVLNRWMGGASGWQHYMANQGYICMTLDNRGSDSRGRDFEQVIHRNLGKAEMADQMEGINYLLNLPYVDGSRIGVHGWSYGGFMTTSLLLNYPDVFKVGVAGGPVIDWKFYEVMYGERYMDTPAENPEGYALASTLNQIKRLRGKLLLIHGDIDDTVVMQNSLSFLKKSVDEGKLVDFLVYPGHPHNVRGKDRVHLMRMVTRYFDDNL